MSLDSGSDDRLTRRWISHDTCSRSERSEKVLCSIAIYLVMIEEDLSKRVRGRSRKQDHGSSCCRIQPVGRKSAQDRGSFDR